MSLWQPHLRGCPAHIMASIRPHHLGLTQPTPSTLISMCEKLRASSLPHACNGVATRFETARNCARLVWDQAFCEDIVQTCRSWGTGLQPRSAHGSYQSPVRDGSPRSLEESIVIVFGHLQAFCNFAPASIPPLRCIGRKGWQRIAFHAQRCDCI
jgi:hypothetical protein